MDKMVGTGYPLHLNQVFLGEDWKQFGWNSNQGMLQCMRNKGSSSLYTSYSIFSKRVLYSCTWTMWMRFEQGTVTHLWYNIFGIFLFERIRFACISVMNRYQFQWNKQCTVLHWDPMSSSLIVGGNRVVFQTKSSDKSLKSDCCSVSQNKSDT